MILYGAALIVAAVTSAIVVRTCVNVPFWDDFDSFLGFLIQMQDASGVWERLQLTTAFHNEHRTVTSRAVVWLFELATGGINFRWLALVSAALFLPIIAIFAAPLRDPNDRAAAAFFGAVLLLNLQHYENLFWGGSACDHLSVVVFALASFALVQRRRPRWTLAAAIACAALASFTLAHGMLAFVAGAVALAWDRRWRAAAVWSAAGAIVIACWFYGYQPGPGQRALDPTLTDAARVARYFLGLLGAPLAFGSKTVAPWIGAGVLGATAIAWRTGWLRQHRFHAVVLLFAFGSLALIALARTEQLGSRQFLVSRYRVLSCLVLATLGWMAFRAVASWRWRELAAGRAMQIALALLAVGFFAEKTISHRWRADAWRDRRHIAAGHYARTGTLAGAPVRIFYNTTHADALLAESARRGIFDLRQVGETAPRVTRIPRSVLGSTAEHPPSPPLDAPPGESGQDK